MPNILRRLLCCCRRPKGDEEEGDNIQISKLRKRKQPSKDQTAEQPPSPSREPTLPVIDPPASHETAASSSHNESFRQRHNESLHPALRAGALGGIPESSSDPDQISYAGSAPMYRNVKMAAQDRNSLMQRLRRPESLAAQPHPMSPVATKDDPATSIDNSVNGKSDSAIGDGTSAKKTGKLPVIIDDDRPGVNGKS